MKIFTRPIVTTCALVLTALGAASCKDGPAPAPTTSAAGPAPSTGVPTAHQAIELAAKPHPVEGARPPMCKDSDCMPCGNDCPPPCPDTLDSDILHHTGSDGGAAAMSGNACCRERNRVVDGGIVSCLCCNESGHVPHPDGGLLIP